MPRSSHGGRHELGQNFLIHAPSITAIIDLVRATNGPITELGAGDGALTEPLAALRRPLTAIELDEHRATRLAERLPHVEVVCGDATRAALRTPVIVGNIPFHVTTPLLRHLLRETGWHHAVLLTQWEVARKRAGVGGGTMMTAQAAPWFTFALHSRVPRHAFRPMPSVDGGIITLARRPQPLVASADAHGYRAFVRAVFGGRGSHLRAIVGNAAGASSMVSADALARANIDRRALPRDVRPEQWAALWHALPKTQGGRTAHHRDQSRKPQQGEQPRQPQQRQQTRQLQRRQQPRQLQRRQQTRQLQQRHQTRQLEQRQQPRQLQQRHQPRPSSQRRS